MSVHGGAGYSDFLRSLRERNTISWDLEQFHWRLLLAGHDFTWKTSSSRVWKFAAGIIIGKYRQQT